MSERMLQKLREEFRAGRLAKAEFIERMHAEHARLFEYAEFLKGGPVEKIEITAGEVRMTMRESGLVISVNPADHRIAPIDALNFGSYEAEETRMLAALVDEGMCIFDIGANLGWYSLLLAKKFRRLEIHAFEPIPSTYASLERHITLNRAAGVHPHPFGLSDKDGEFSFYFYPEGSVNASLANVSGRAGAREIRCRVRRLDDFAQESGKYPDLVKCDVEGAELLVFKGGARTIAEHKPVIFTEMLRKWSAKFSYHPNEIIDLLENMGYRPYVIRAGKLATFGRMDEETVDTNFFFLHAEKHADRLKRLS